MATQFVQLNVGGVPHTTTRETLMREPSSRLALMARGVLPCATGADGALFVDRSPRFFQTILNYLRDGWVLLPKTAEERRELLQEIGYFQLTGFEAWLRAQDIANPAPSDRAPSPGLFGSPGAASSLGSPSIYRTHSAFSGYAGSPGAGSPPPLPIAAVSRPSVWDAPDDAAAAAAVRSSMYSPDGAVYGRASVMSPLPPAPYPSASMLLAQAPLRASSYFAPLPAPGASLAPMARAASASAALPELGNGKFVPQPLDPAAFRWTSKYLATNEKMRDVVATLLELAFMPPHRALHPGKVSITIASECTHDRMASLLGGGAGESHGLRDKLQVVSVKGSSGWAFEMALKTSGEAALFDKYSVAEYVQDNWFVLAAILKDEYGILIEEDTSSRPACAACRRCNVSLTMEKHF